MMAVLSLFILSLLSMSLAFLGLLRAGFLAGVARDHEKLGIGVLGLCTLRDTLLSWIVEYNLPGAAVPWVWRIRPKNEKAAAETRKIKAGAAEATDKAIRAIVKAAAGFKDDAIAREYIVSFDITDQLSDQTIDALVAARHSFGGAAEAPDPFVTAEEPAAFAAARLKKKPDAQTVSPPCLLL